MAVGEQARHALYGRLEQMLGAEDATTLMSYLPPTGWADVAVKRDLDALEERLNLRFAAVDERLDLRFAAVDERFRTLELRIDLTEQRLLAAFRGELNAAVTSQTRTMLYTMAGTVVSLGGMALALARFA